MKKLLLFALGISVLLGVAFGAMLYGATADTWSPRDYIPATGDCLVPPQGDPLYDEHYSFINERNCSAMVDQETAQSIEQETTESRMGMYVGILVFIVVGIGLVLLVVAIVRGNGGQV